MAAPPSRPARNWGARVHEIAVAGVRAVVLENELLRVTVLAGLGSDVIEFCYKPRDLDATWLSPGGLRDPRGGGRRRVRVSRPLPGRLAGGAAERRRAVPVPRRRRRPGRVGGRVLGLEPFSSYPTNGLAETVANGTALVLPPGGGRELWWRVGIVDTEVRTK
jgi:hypothetical protein